MCRKSSCCTSISQCLFITFNAVLFVSSLAFLFLTLGFILNSYRMYYIYEIKITLCAFASALVVISVYGFAIGFCINKIALKVYACLMGIMFVSNLTTYSVLFGIYPEFYYIDWRDYNDYRTFKIFVLILSNSVFLTLEALLVILSLVFLFKIEKKETITELNTNRQNQVRINLTNPTAPRREIVSIKTSEPPQYNRASEPPQYYGLYPESF